MKTLLHSIAALALGGALVLLPIKVSAHFKLLQPPSVWIAEDGGLGVPPCGDGRPAEVVTKVRGGHPYEIRILEYAIHPGHYRIALSVNSRAELPKDPDVDAKDNRSVSATIDANPKIPVLADGLFVHTTAPQNTEWQTEVMLPNIDCDRCTLQVIQFMANHEFNPGGGYYYHHCADLKIAADPKLPPADKAWLNLSQ